MISSPLLRSLQIVALTLAGVTAATCNAQLYEITELGHLGGGSSNAKAINESNQIIGDSTLEGGFVHAFLWQIGIMDDLGTLGGPISSANDINEAGMIVGFSLNSDFQNRGFLYENGSMSDLETLGGFTSSANAINNNNQIVGSAQLGNGLVHAVIWEKVGNDWIATDLGTLGGNNSEATDINDAGQIVGASRTAGGDLHAFIWESGVMTDLGTLGGLDSSASSINESGLVVGIAQDVSDIILPVFWLDGTPTALETFGGDTGLALSVDNSGNIVGGANTEINGPFACIWEDGVITNLDSKTGPSSTARDISEQGTIVGNLGGMGVFWVASGDQFSVIDLGTLGGEFSIANAINENGQITGVSDDDLGSILAFIWDRGVMTSLGHLGGGSSVGADINNSNHVVGFSATQDESLHAFFWDGNQMIDLGTLGGASSDAQAINDADIVVGSSLDSNFDTQPYVFENGVMAALPAIGQGNSGAANDINNSDEIVGWALNSSFEQRAVKWTRSGNNWSAMDLDTLGGSFAIATGINEAGQIVGQSQTDTGRLHAFLWDSGVMTDLGVIGGTFSVANDVNSELITVGDSSTGDGRVHAFVYRNDSMKNMNDLIDRNSPWELTNANGINSLGDIVGTGALGAFLTRAYMLQLSPRSSDATLDSIIIATGVILAGDVSDITSSDDSYLRTRSGFGPSFVDLHNMELIVNATGSGSPITLDISIESFIDEPAGLVQLRLRNWNTNQMESVGQYPINDIESISLIQGINAVNYVGQNGEIELSIKHLVFVPFLAFTFESFLDHVQITLN